MIAGARTIGVCVASRGGESLRRRFEDALDEGQLRELAADVLLSLEASVEEFRSRACAAEPEGADWVRGRARRSRTEWVG